MKWRNSRRCSQSALTGSLENTLSDTFLFISEAGKNVVQLQLQHPCFKYHWPSNLSSKMWWNLFLFFSFFCFSFELSFASVNWCALCKCERIDHTLGSNAELFYFSLSWVPPDRDPDQRNPWAFIPLQSLHPTSMHSSRALHEPLSPVVIYGLGPSNTSLDSPSSCAINCSPLPAWGGLGTLQGLSPFLKIASLCFLPCLAIMITEFI